MGQTGGDVKSTLRELIGYVTDRVLSRGKSGLEVTMRNGVCVYLLPYNPAMTVKARTLNELNELVVGCARCPRLRSYCAEVARVKRRSYLGEEYWGKPVPGFGDPQARVMVLGLAPGAHGSNRTGRMFTGDGSGDFMYPVLHEVGFASQAEARGLGDGLELRDMWITAVGRCAPPQNKPTTEELANCAPWLDEEIQLLGRLKVVVCLGRIAFDGFLASAVRRGVIKAKRGYVFGHGVEYELPDGVMLLASFHPSLQNTNTGKLTRGMFVNIFERAQQIASSVQRRASSDTGRA